MVSSTVQIISTFYASIDDSLEAGLVSSHILNAIADVAIQKSSLSLSSISDLQDIIAKLKQSANAEEYTIQTTAEEVMVESVAKANSLYEESRIGGNTMYEVVQISILSQTKVASELKVLALNQNETTYTKVRDFTNNIALNNSVLFADIIVDNSLFFVNVPDAGDQNNITVSLTKEEMNFLDEESERIVDFIEDHYIYFIVGGSVMVIALLVLSWRLFAQNSQIVKPLEE